MTIPKAALGLAVETNSFEGIRGTSPMLRKILALGLLAASLVAPSTFAQTAPAGTPAPAANAVDAASIQALKDMGAFLQTLKRFHVSTEATGERVLADGQKLQHVATAELDVDRPNKLRAVIRNARSQREIIYDGKTVTFYTPAQKYYSTVEFSEPIGGLIDKLEQRYGVQLPLQDLFLFGTPMARLDKIESAMNAGQDFIDEDLCDHYAFRQGTIDWQIWISSTGGQAVAAQDRDHQSRRRSASAVDLGDRLEPEADLQGFGVQVHAAPGSEEDRDRSAKDLIEDCHHEETIREIAGDHGGHPRGGQLCDGFLRRCRG